MKMIVILVIPVGVGVFMDAVTRIEDVEQVCRDGLMVLVEGTVFRGVSG